MSLFCKCVSIEDVRAEIAGAKVEFRIEVSKAIETAKLELSAASLTDDIADKILLRMMEKFGSPYARPEWFIQAVVEAINRCQVKK